jgi:hypothetical protein
MKIYSYLYIIFTILSIIAIIRFIYLLLFYQFFIKKWQRIEGEILLSEKVYYKENTDTEGWEEKIIYMFVVNGEIYKSSVITKNLTFLYSFQNSFKLRYNVGQKIIVYYNKKNPQESIIDGKFSYNNFILIFMSLFIYFVANSIRNEV